MTPTTPPLPTSDDPASTFFVDRRSGSGTEATPGVERRQFANSHHDLSPEARELARAVDAYKVRHRRRFITFEELLQVVTDLGYTRPQ